MHGYLASMFFDNIIYIVQAESKSFYLLCISLWDAKEFFKYVLKVLRWYTHSIVADTNGTVAGIFYNINPNLNGAIGIFDGIIYNIMKGGFQMKPVSLYESRTFSGQLET